MAIYETLSLKHGGGIISQNQQSEQVENTATILIGLGGTGIDCLTEIKHAVNNRLLPDNPGEPEPRYQRIQFIGVDTDSCNRKGVLAKAEFFDISHPEAYKMLQNAQALKCMKAFDWLDDSNRILPYQFDSDYRWHPGPWGIRAAGRFFFMLRSHDFYDEVMKRITIAKRDNPGCELIVHIFSGLGGGTGAGTFLDACYLAKEAVKHSGGGNVFGYFFLPDVNLDIDRIPQSNKLVRDYIPVNGYAAMQELDYCMRLEENAGGFRQQYMDGLIVDWKEAPVDTCHLIGASDTKGNIVSNAYVYAMKATAEYVMNFLTKPEDPTNFRLKLFLANFKPIVNRADSLKRIGSNLRYCVIGGACASIPMGEINTYLASSLFALFSAVRNRIADKREVEGIAAKARINNLDMLLNELSENGGDSQFSQNIDFRTARDVGSGPIVRDFEKQRTERQGALERNSKSMQDGSNAKSLISRICGILDSFACDLSYGTTFASSVISATQSHNLLNIIDGLLEENERRLRNERAQFEDDPASGFIGRRSAYNQAKLAFDAKPKKRQFNDLIDAMFYLEESNVNITRHEQMKTILTTLRKQLVSQSNGYYQILARVMDNLADTFAENARVLSGDPESLLDPSKFITPIIKLSDIKGTLDAEIEKLRDSMPNLYGAMVGGMIQDSSFWVNEDQGKISRYINDFFVTQIFGDSSANSFANKTISEYLTIKYDTNDSAILKDRIYNDYMLPMAERANPLFPEDKTISPLYTSGSMTIVSVPNTAQEIQDAAEDLKDIVVYTNALRDRIYMMKCTFAVPIAAYSHCSEYGRIYFTGSRPDGTNYYEGRGGSKWFNDWRKLPPLVPAQVIERDKAPDAVSRQIDEMDALLKVAVESGLLNGSRCMKLSEESKKALEGCEAVIKKAERDMKAAPEKTLAICQSVKSDLADVLEDVTLEETPYSLPEGTKESETHIENIRRDYFMISPAIQEMMRKDIELISSVKAGIAKMDQAEAGFSDAQKDIEDYCIALFTGVIQTKGLAVFYSKKEYGSETRIELSKRDDAFRYQMVPLYQGYVSYLALDEADREEIAGKASALLEEAANGENDAVLDTMQAFGNNLTEEENDAMAGEAANYYLEVSDDILTFVAFINKLYNSIIVGICRQ